MADSEGIPREAIRAFGSLGANGCRPANQERDLHTWLRHLWGFSLETYVVPMGLEASWFWHGVSVFLCFIVCVKTSQPLIGRVSHGLLKVNGWRSKPRSTPVHVLLPHEVIHCLATKSMSAFQSIMLGDLSDDARRNFWEVTKGLEPWKDHPIHTSDAPYHRLIPCAIHADGAQFYRDDEFYVWSWSSLWGGQGMVQDVLLYKWPIAIIPERHMRTPSATCYRRSFCFVS